MSHPNLRAIYQPPKDLRATEAPRCLWALSTCVGPSTFFAFAGFFAFALVLLRVAASARLPRSPAVTPAVTRTVIPLARGPRPYDWDREGI